MNRTVKVTSAYGEHKGGTKDYTIIKLQSPVGGSLLVRRWGKIGAPDGQSKIDLVQGKMTFDDALDERRSGGYDMRIIQTGEVQLHELNRVLSPKQLKAMELRHIRWMFSDAELDDVPGASGNMANERHEMRMQMERAAEEAKKALADEEAARVEQELAGLKSNPLFGMF